MVTKLMVLSILYLAGPTWEQSIEWVDPYRIYGMYYQPGLIQKRDAIILYGEINLGQTTGFDRVHYEIKKPNMAYSTLCYLYLTKCEGFKNSFCYCKTTSNAHVFEVVVNITADTSLSEAKVKGAMEIYDKRINSVEKSIPKIYDGTKIQVNMYVNGMIGNASKCDMEITGNDLCIAIEIPDIVNLQYQLLLKNVKTNMVLRNESKSVFYSTQVMDTLQLAVYFQVYDVPDSQQHFQCFIQAKSPDDEKDNPFSVLFGFTLAFLLIILLLIFVSFLYRKRILSYFESKKTKKHLRQSPKDMGKTNYVNVPSEEESTSHVNSQDQKDENADVMTCGKSNVSAEKNVIIPEQIFVKIKEVKTNKENKKNPVLNLWKKVRSIVGSKYDFLSDLAICQLETMVNVDVEVVSNRRPKHWPGTKVPYPLSGKTKWKRNGYGRIINVRKLTNYNKQSSHVWRTFPSLLFSKSESGPCEWVEVLVYISRHLVFDDIEAKHTSCKFMKKTGLHETIQFQRAVVRLANVEENWTLLSFFSKDVSIYNNLQENLKIFLETWKGLDISKVISFIVYSIDMKFKKTNFADLFDMFSEDKTLSFCLNTYFEQQKLAIFFERASARFMRMYQMKSDIGTLDDIDLSDEDLQLKLSSMPFIIKNVQKIKQDDSKYLEAMSYGHC